MIRLFRFFFSLFIFIALTFGALFITDYANPLHQNKTIWVKKGTGFLAIGRQLQREGMISRIDQFVVPALLVARNDFKRLKAGEYEITKEMSMLDVVRLMRDSKTFKRSFQIIEGVRATDVLKAVNENIYFGGKLLENIEEGSVYPDTYFYDRGDDRKIFITNLQKRMTQTLSTFWAAGHPDVLKTPQQALVLASLVEKEARLAEERPMIAAVFLNRLKKGMRLESCASVLYAFSLKGTEKHFVTYDDLKIESPYNTYIYGGLTPTPIAMPSKAALEAVFNPAPISYLYFVVNGKGGHFFADSFQMHQLNIQKSRKIIKENQ